MKLEGPGRMFCERGGATDAVVIRASYRFAWFGVMLPGPTLPPSPYFDTALNALEKGNNAFMILIFKGRAMATRLHLSSAQYGSRDSRLWTRTNRLQCATHISHRPFAFSFTRNNYTPAALINLDREQKPVVHVLWGARVVTRGGVA